MLRTVGFPSAQLVEELGLATDRNSLARYSKRTHGPCVHGFRRFVPWGPHAAYRQLVSGSFHLPSEVLFSVRSRYYCTIGLGTYLGSEDCTSQLPAQYPMHGTRDPFNHTSFVRLRDYHPLRSAVPGTFYSESQRVRRSTTPHLPALTAQGFGLSLAVFDLGLIFDTANFMPFPEFSELGRGCA
jgi:hypothetical protein